MVMEFLGNLVFRYIVFIMICIVSLIIFSSLLKSNSKLIQKYSEAFFSYALLIASFLKLFFYDLHKNVFRWPETADYVISYKILHPEFLKNDLSVNALIQSPKFLFSKFITMLDSFNISPLLFAEILDLLRYFYPVIFFQITVNILKFWFNNKNIYMCYLFMFLLLLHETAVSPIFSLILGNSAGYPTTIHMQTAYSSYLSYFFGFVFLLSYSKNYQIISLLMFFISCILNPVLGISILSFWFIFFFLKSLNYSHLVILTGCLLIVAIGIKMSFSYETNLSPETFINIHIYERHPHHFHISKIFNGRMVFIPIVILLPYFFSNIPRLKLVFLFCFIFYSGSIFLTYFFIELFPTKLIATLTPNRFTRLGIQLLLFEYCLFINHILNQKNRYDRIIKFLSKINNIDSMLNAKRLFQILIKTKKYFYFINVCFFIIIVINIPKNKLLKVENGIIPDSHNFIEWINDSTLVDDTFIVYPNDFNFNSYMRIFARRAIYVDHLFPFNENYFIEWSNRNKLIKNYFKDPSKNIGSLKGKAEYLILRDFDDKRFNSFKPYASFQKFKIFSVEEMLKN